MCCVAADCSISLFVILCLWSGVVSFDVCMMDCFEARTRVGLVCFCKASRLLSSHDPEFIRNHVVMNYNLENTFLWPVLTILELMC